MLPLISTMILESILEKSFTTQLTVQFALATTLFSCYFQQVHYKIHTINDIYGASIISN